ncbi:peptide chain release factor N(5)-glutamine methyltransferase [Devosia submarina]|uniref:peptide chain release factor N(5)-glutamine methyltransferase n=1 Tax=Devosia submarina TaxID=1173082 RepID=UPI001AECFE2C|nr:peptide chain release factor N(5)-glutamine methyltransferase [Devosia submarina]
MWRQWRDELTRSGSPTPALDAKLLTGHALGLSPLEMAIREQEPVSDTASEKAAALMHRRLLGESVARIIGEREFYGLPFRLNAATLEPRPETELLVDLAIAALPQGGRLLDLGTGTGCIPIAILANRPDASAVAIDLSAQALEAAGENAQRNTVADRVSLLQGSWFEPLRLNSPHDANPTFNLIVSNPPYITSAVVETLAPEVKNFDPRLALDGGPDGLAPYRVIAANAAHHLVPGGEILLEIGYDQGEAVPTLLMQAGFSGAVIHKDLNGLDRVVQAHHL